MFFEFMYKQFRIRIGLELIQFGYIGFIVTKYFVRVEESKIKMVAITF